MDRRFITFIVLAIGIIVGHQWLMNKFFPAPKKPPQAQNAPADGKPGEKKPDDKKVDDKKPAADLKAEPKAVQAPAAVVAQPAANVAPQWATLGSLEEASPYRMLVTFTNRGAAVERVELNHPRYHEVDNIHPVGGYLGHLAVEDVREGEGAKAKGVGCKVNVVGTGTPASLAGLQPGDVITSLADKPTPDGAALHEALHGTDWRSRVKVKYKRGGADHEVEIALRRMPLQLLHPEFTDPQAPEKADPLSFLLTLQEAAGQVLDVEGDELPGVALYDSYWELLPADPKQPHSTAFRKVLPDQKVEITKRYTLERRDVASKEEAAGAYTLNLRVELKNLDAKPAALAYRLAGPTGLPVEGAWYSRDSKIGIAGACGMRDVVHGQFNGKYVEHGMFTCTQIVDKQTSHLTAMPISYIGVDAMYFSAVILPQQADPNEHRFSRVVPLQVGTTPPEAYRKKETDVSFRMTRTPAQIAPGEMLADDFKIYLGPKVPKLLAEYNMSAQIDYGWFDWIAEPMLFLLHTFYGWVGNYGIAIIMLTVVVRSAMFPLSRKQALNAMKMQELQPEIKRLGEKHKGKREELAKAQQDLFRKHKYNPFAGCMPIFVQIPIFVGLYNSLKIDVELRQAPLISESIRWASNLSAPDMFWYWQPYLPGMLAGDNGWLGPFLNLLPCVTVTLFLIQNKMFMPPPTDEQTAMQQKMIKYMMLFMGVMFFKVPAGLCVYFITSSIWSIAERKLLPKMQHASQPASAAVIDVTATKPADTPKKQKKR